MTLERPGGVEKFGVARAFTGHEEPVSRMAIMDAVTIATPIGLHYEQGRQALLAGKLHPLQQKR